MDRLDEMRVFARVVEMRSFRRAAESLGLSPSTVTDAVKRIEARLGARLLDRTTRVVAPTLDGEAWYARCLRILAEVEDAEATFSRNIARGRLRVDVHGIVAQRFLMPRLPGFLARHPELELILSDGDRLVDLIREGVDCVIRVAEPDDSDLIVRRLGAFREAVAAAPEYVDRYGLPATPDELGGHRMVGFLSSRTGTVLELEFKTDDRIVRRALPASLLTTGAELMVDAARRGLGLIQVPRYHLEEDFESGRLVEVLPGFAPDPSPVMALYPRDRQLSPRLRVFLDWLSQIDFGRGD